MGSYFKIYVKAKRKPWNILQENFFILLNKREKVKERSLCFVSVFNIVIHKRMRSFNLNDSKA